MIGLIDPDGPQWWKKRKARKLEDLEEGDCLFHT